MDNLTLSQAEIEQFADSMNELSENLGKTMASIGKSMSLGISMLAHHFEEWAKVFNDAQRGLYAIMPNNWLKMHGYPMRRKGAR